MPTLVVFAAPQKQTATTRSLDILFTVMARRNTSGRRVPSLESAMCVFRSLATGEGGYAIEKQTTVKTRYSAMFKKTSKITDDLGSNSSAPVSKALENVDLYIA
ncbi:hypothetical protein RRF57_007779 [Xylaria bambusicola]|uniref:Uncharacterized protein n=1 Tax=Xylaria bambusicola TaxID=326684 RepID=A0AAN7UGQ7_9PEZI